MPLQATSGAASYDGFGGGVAAVPQYIEDVFSTYLYTGNGNTNAQTITNAIDLAGKGGMVWIKSRSAAYAPTATDTARGAGNQLNQNTTDPNSPTGAYGISFNNNGFNIGTSGTGSSNGQNFLDATFASWTFRKQPKFFDVVTWTGDGTANRAISHNLGSVPGMVFLKKTSGAGEWYAWSRAYSFNGGTAPSDFCMGSLDAAIAFNGGYSEAQRFAPYPTSTVFYTGSVTTTSGVNNSGDTYVAYLFAHNAGGFGLTGTDNVISCGSFTTDGSGNASVTLGYEPQWVMTKVISQADSWYMGDVMRGMVAQPGLNNYLIANTSAAEVSGGARPCAPTSTGFLVSAEYASATYIYIAIRRGPMKVPTSGTSVFSPTLQAASSTPQTKNYGITTDSVLALPRNGTGYSNTWWSRLQGANIRLSTQSTNAESSATTDALIGFDAQTGVRLGADASSWIQRTVNWVHLPFQRAPSFFDEVCYTGTGSATTVTHNLGVAPQLIIAKSRSGAFNWTVYSSTLGNSYPLFLNGNSDGTTNYGALMWGSTAPTSTQFPVGTYTGTNSNGQTYVAYLFATCAGVSKVGSYTGNGTTQTIDCGFTGGARFVLIKRTDAAGDWYVWDTARGIISANDPHLSLNTTAAEVTTDDTIDPDSTGFIVNQVTATNVNVSSATYIYLAIA